MKFLKAKFGTLLLLTVLSLCGSAFGQVSGTNNDSFPDNLSNGGEENYALFTCFNFTTGNLWFSVAPVSELPALRLECTKSGGTVLTGG